MSDLLSFAGNHWATLGIVVGVALVLAAWRVYRVLTAARDGALGQSFAGATWSKFSRSVSLAVKSLWLHKLRSFLSVLGIIIGTSAVISLMAFGEGSMQDALADIKRQGATNIIVRSVKPPDDSATSQRGFVTTYGMTERDLKRFSTFGPVISRRVELRVLPSEARYLERMANARVVATVPEYAEV